MTLAKSKSKRRKKEGALWSTTKGTEDRGQFDSQLNYKQVPYLITNLVPILEACEFRVLTPQGGKALSG